MNVQAIETNKFWRVLWKDPERSFQGSRWNIIVIIPLVTILHIYLFVLCMEMFPWIF